MFSTSENEYSRTLVCLVALALFMDVVKAVMNAFVFTALWGWFIFPLTEFPAPSIPQSIGLFIIAGLFVKNHRPSADKNSGTTGKDIVNEALAEVFAQAVFAPLITLLIGWIVSLFL